MNRSGLGTKRYRSRIAVASLVALFAIALGWHWFSDFEAHRAGYISAVLSWGRGCGAKISPSAQERLKYYQQQGEAGSFNAGFALGRKQLLEHMHDPAGYADACLLYVDHYAHASETALLIALPSKLSEVEWPLWLMVLLTAWLLLRSLVSTFRQPGVLPSLSTMKNWRRVLSLLCLAVSVGCVAAIALEAPLDGFGGYYATDPQRETLFATALFGLGPLATCIALFGVSRWVIGHKARRKREPDRIEPPIGEVMAQAPRYEAMEAAPAMHRLREVAANFGANQRLPTETANRTGKVERTIPRAAKRGKKQTPWSQVLRMLDQRERQEHAELAKQPRAAAHSEPDQVLQAELNRLAQANERFAKRGSPDEAANNSLGRVRPGYTGLGRARR
jgi:hypothetical protein